MIEQISINNENIFDNNLFFSDKKLYPVNEKAEFSKPIFIRKETTLIEQPYPNINCFLQQCTQNLEEQSNFFKKYFEDKVELKQIEWLTISHTSTKMIHYNVIAKIHVTGKSLLEAYFSSFQSFDKNKADCSLEVFANSRSEFDHCYFRNSNTAAVIIRDFSSAKFKNCVFENNKISAFISNNSYAEFENCIFLNDTNTTLFAGKNSQIKIKNCQFKNVTKAIFCKDEVTVRIDNTEFKDCLKGAATIANKSTLMLNNIFISNSSNTAIRAIGSSIVKAQKVSINRTKGNAINIDNSSGYFHNCKLTNNTDYPTIAIRGIHSNPIFSNCEVLDNGDTFAVVIKNCSRPLFDNCLFTKCDSNCFSISDFSMPLVQDCKFSDIRKFWLNIYGNSTVTLDGEYKLDKINLSKNSKILNEQQRLDEEMNFIAEKNDESDNEEQTYYRSWKPSSYGDVPKVENMEDPEGMFNGRLSPLPLLSIEKIMENNKDDNISLKCCDHNHEHDESEIYVSAQCGHCFCKKCNQNCQSKCPVCDTQVKSLKKVFREERCVICLDRAATTVITSCGHMCMCYECAMKCSEQNFKCPLCNQPIVSYRYMCDE